MVREDKISVPVTEQEKKLIKANAKLHRYRSTAAFLRDRALDHDISNKAALAVVLTYISSHIGDISKDRALDWTRKKSEIKQKLTSELAGMDKDQKDQYLGKLEKTLDNALEVKKELDSILGKYYVD